MKIVFVGIAVESLAIEFLSSYIKAHGHQSELVFDPVSFSTEVISFAKISHFFDIREAVVKQILEKKPDLVGFSVFTINYQRALTLARLLKKHAPNLPIIFGGIHPTSVPERVIKQSAVDMVCVGEAEEALVELLDSLQKSKTNTNIKNIWFKNNGRVIKNPIRPLIADLDTLPFPDKDLYLNIYRGFADDYYTISSRGCPFSCTYCSNSIINGLYRGLGQPIRRRSPQNIVSELAWAKKKYHLKKITFVDDVFVQDLSWLKKFTTLYRQKVNLPYAMLTHPKFINPQIARLLVKSGCYFLLFGIQSASENIRRQILNRHETNAEIAAAADCCHRAGLKFSIDHIFSIPKEGIKEYEQALSFYNQLRPDIINAYWLQYFPKTKIIQSALQEKILSSKDVTKIEEGLTNTSPVAGFGTKDDFNDHSLSNFQFFFMLLPIFPSRFTSWVIKHKLYLKKFHPPVSLNIFIKFFITIIRRRGIVYWGIIKSIVSFAIYSIKVKYRYAKIPYHQI